VPRLVQRKMAEMPGNRLVEHLSHCATVYRCPAAQNFFYDRFEAPMPSSPSCNSACVGCISLQNEPGRVASHDRILFVPEPEEFAQMAVPHLERAKRAIVSFGQGCEGEPLNQGPALLEAVRLIRGRTQRGRVHLNTNGSRPGVVAQLMEAGLNSIRVSLNSAVESSYNAYYRPIGYRFADVVESIRIVVRGGGWASINLLVFPGVTDLPEEITALVDLVRGTGLHMVQMRNLNIDPELYLDSLGIRDERPGLGVPELMARLERARPGLRFGYFNPPTEDGAPAPPPSTVHV
jgi:pyruvate-formate lyase-activating enzyme